MEQSRVVFELLLHKAIGWAQEEETIRGLAVIGSQARQDHPADPYSDLDIVLVSTDLQRYITSPEWVDKIGVPWLTFIEPAGAGPFFERRVLFQGGVDVDFAFLPVQAIQSIRTSEFSNDLAWMVKRGMQSILDKDGLIARIMAATPMPEFPRQPSQEEFLNLVNDFWYHSVWTAKKLRRGELWTAKGCSDNYMKGRLLRVIEWQSHTLHGQDYDTWHNGRYLEEWAEPWVIESLGKAYSRYELADIWRGLFASIDLFHSLATETADLLGYPYPSEGEARAIQTVKQLYENQI